jgi:hypothetical protein
MMDRTEQLESALRANYALIAEAQAEMTRYLSKGIESAEFVDRLLKLLDGPQQREAQRLTREALGEDFGNNA